MQFVHYLTPDRRSTADPRNIVHGLARGIADPDGDGEIAGKADAPVVAHILAGPGFDRRRVSGGQPGFQTASARPRRPVSEDVGDEKCRFRAVDRAHLALKNPFASRLLAGYPCRLGTGRDA